MDPVNKKVVGIGINRSHGSSLCLVDSNGRPIFAASEERFTRFKLQKGMPYKTYKCLKKSYDLSGAKIGFGRLDHKHRFFREIDYYRNSLRKNLFAPPINILALEFAKDGTGKRYRRTKIFID